MKAANSSAPAGAKRSPGHRAVDARDAIAELTERAQEISQEAGSRVSLAMKDVISAAAGIAGFAVESARDLVQFMVRRGQMTPEEGDKLLREAEASHSKRPAAERKKPTASQVQARERQIQRAKAAADREAAHQAARASMVKAAAAKHAKKPASKPASKSGSKAGKTAKGARKKK